MGVPRKLKLLHKTAKTPSKEVAAKIHSRLRERLRVIDAASNPIIITDKNNLIVYINSRAEQFLGYDGQAMLGEQLGDHFSLSNPTDRLTETGRCGNQNQSPA